MERFIQKCKKNVLAIGAVGAAAAGGSYLLLNQEVAAQTPEENMQGDQVIQLANGEYVIMHNPEDFHTINGKLVWAPEKDRNVRLLPTPTFEDPNGQDAAGKMEYGRGYWLPQE